MRPELINDPYAPFGAGDYLCVILESLMLVGLFVTALLAVTSL